MTNLLFYRILSVLCRIITKVYRLHRTLILYAFRGIGRVNFVANELAIICWQSTKNNYYFFNVKMGSWICIHKILYDTAVIMLEKTMFLPCLAIMVSTMQKHNTKLSTVNQYKCQCICRVFYNHCWLEKRLNFVWCCFIFALIFISKVIFYICHFHICNFCIWKW